MDLRILAGRPLGIIAALVVVGGALATSKNSLSAQQPPPGGNPRIPTERKLLYVGSPGAGSSENGTGLLVFDANRNFKFVKRIQTWDYPAGKDPCCEAALAF